MIVRPRSGETGQASVELFGALPLLLVVGLFLFQMLALGYAVVLAGNAAEAGALALASDDDPDAAARRALPGWSRGGMAVDRRGGTVRVRLRPPSPIAALSRTLEVSSDAVVRAP
jgi:hypothetical protein